MKLEDLSIAVYADGADVEGMLEMAKKSYIKGFTTNPSLMKKAGITDYVCFAQEILAEIKDAPVSFEVFSDNFEEMKKEARILASLADNVFVKIPVTNSKGEPSYQLIKELAEEGVKINVTSVFTLDQVEAVKTALSANVPGIISVFAGRIADTGIDAREHMRATKELCRNKPSIMLLWASCREVYNIIEAQEAGADIVTVTNDILEKAENNMGKPLEQYSLETVNMFLNDAVKLGFSILGEER